MTVGTANHEVSCLCTRQFLSTWEAKILSQSAASSANKRLYATFCTTNVPGAHCAGGQQLEQLHHGRGLRVCTIWGFRVSPRTHCTHL